MKLKVVFVFMFFLTTFAFANLEKSVVRISSTLSLYDYKEPWKETKQKDIVGSGVIIKNNYILTSAHVVTNAKIIEIKKSGSLKKYFAKIKYISYQADLALLEIYDKNFFKDTKALKINSQVKKEDKIKIAGYPFSRNKLLVKSGNISSLEYMAYSFSNEKLLALKLNVDAKEGNSGGPILDNNGQIIGIAIQIPKKSKNIAYATPSVIIKTFLEDIKDKKVDGSHSNSNSYQYLENPNLQSYYKVDKNAILVTDIDLEEKQLKVDDIILKVNGKNPLSLDEFLFNFQKRVITDRIKLELLRDTKVLNIEYKLYQSKKLINQEFASKPRYYIFGGLVFTPITRNYLQAIGMKQYVMDLLFYEQKSSLERQEIVAWMERKFLHKINKGYHSKVEIVHKVNDIKVKNFEHFTKLIEESKEEYIVIDFIKKQRVIFNKEEAIKSFLEIEKKYKI